MVQLFQGGVGIQAVLDELVHLAHIVAALARGAVKHQLLVDSDPTHTPLYFAMEVREGSRFR